MLDPAKERAFYGTMMFSRFLVPVVLTPFLLGSILVAADDTGPDLSKMKVQDIFGQYCANCHGKKFEGGQGGSLVDGEWKHGGSDEDLFRSIAKGNLELGMTPWEGILSHDQIRAMVIFIREKEKETKVKGMNFPVPEPGKVTKTKHHNYIFEMVVEKGLENPWALAFLPDGRKLVTEKAGGIRIIEADGTLNPKPVAGTPEVILHGQGGMLEVAPHPDYASNGWIYLGFSDGWREEIAGKKKPKIHTQTAVVRGRIKDHAWVDQEWIYKADKAHYTSSGAHFGTRFVLDQGYLYFIIGERGGLEIAQDLNNPAGKIFRVHDDGRVPKDNPFVGQEGALPEIWSYGHRNPQGLDIDSRDGQLYDSEHGPRGGDELNLIRRGANYGWPLITYGMNYNGTPMTSETHRKGMDQPVTYWTPSIATCGLSFYRGDRFSKWKNDLFVGALKQKEVRRLRLIDQEVVEQVIILKDYGRVRDVTDAPDGYLYVILNDPDCIVRLTPQD
ncbi:MAG: secretion protein HlyD [Verrucomicrobiaceae bacterium]|nr:secretion protein HlyD [Verrucomicrobiaceae bacterium]